MPGVSLTSCTTFKGAKNKVSNSSLLERMPLTMSALLTPEFP